MDATSTNVVKVEQRIEQHAREWWVDECPSFAKAHCSIWTLLAMFFEAEMRRREKEKAANP